MCRNSSWLSLCFRKQIVFVILFLCFFIAQAQTPTANFTTNKSALCVGANVIFTNASSGSITSYSWNFGSGATPATANTAGPHSVTFSTTGTKTISLTVTGTGGSNTITKTNVVSVGFERIKVMSANLLNYPDNAGPTADTTARHPYFRTVAAATLPDILVTGEMNSQNGVDWYLTKVLNTVSSGYAAGTFINGADTDNGLFYKSSKFSFVSNTRIKTDLRDINEFKLVHTLTGDTLRIYAVHLKASTGTTEEAQRAQEVDSLRKVTDALPLGSNFIVCGDFNIYKTSESAYQKLILVNPANEGYVVDPLPLTGTWNNPSFAIYHTQSTRTRAFNNGSTGGLNDRFDMLLFSKAVNLSGGVNYVAGSTTAFGNDGNHYNDSINKPTNTAVSQTIADALEIASDHLPLFASFDFELNNCSLPDMGALALTIPASSICQNANQALQIQIKNYATTAIDFSLSNTNITLTVTNPSAINKTLTKNISTGTLSAGSSLLVTFDSTYNMSAVGNYTFNAFTSLSNDGNTANDAMAATVIAVGQNSATITPSGSQLICKGDSITLTASNGINYLWSNGASMGSIYAKDSGNYSVTVTGANGCTGSSGIVHIAYNYFSFAGTLFSETMGTVTGTTAIATHETNNGFDNDNYTMTGSADLRITTPSTTTYYAVASGGANIFITNAVGKNFIISGINTTGYNNLALKFGIYKNTNSSTGSDLSVRLSTDGINYDSVSYTFTTLPTGSGSAIYHYVTLNGVIPATSNLRIQFKQTGIITQYRIDDVLLIYANNTPSITTSGATTFCTADSVNLAASAASAYLWSNGKTMQSIYAKTTGHYFVSETSANGCKANTDTVAVTANYCNFNINAKIFIEGFYIGNGLMNAIIDPVNYPNLCDTVEMQLAQPITPYSILYSNKKAIATNGAATFNFITSPIYGSYYLVIKHRNAIETWSATPVTINSFSNPFDFTSGTANRFSGSQLNPSNH